MSPISCTPYAIGPIPFLGESHSTVSMMPAHIHFSAQAKAIALCPDLQAIAALLILLSDEDSDEN